MKINEYTQRGERETDTRASQAKKKLSEENEKFGFKVKKMSQQQLLSCKNSAKILWLACC